MEAQQPGRVLSLRWIPEGEYWLARVTRVTPEVLEALQDHLAPDEFVLVESRGDHDEQ
jgi:hypothetical protein